jgi:predicted dehydrogenase/nucleoside-diphosphate-sugar epimerase
MSGKQHPRLAIIGCGAVVDYHQIPSLRRIGWLPKVLVDVSDARLDLVAGNLGGHGKNVIKAKDWTTVAGEFDAAIIAAPHAFHGTLGRDLARAGKHVFLEKPLALTSAECDAVIDAAQASGVILRVGLLRRYLHAARWLKALLEAGVLGKLKRFDAREGFVFNWAMSSPASITQATSGGGVLVDTGAHTLDLLTWWLGDVASFVYRDDSAGGVEADCQIDCHLASGAIGRVELSRTRELKNSVRIQGSTGWIEVHLSDNKVLGGSEEALAFLHDGMTANVFPQQRFPDLFDAEFRDFLASVNGTGSEGVGGRAAARSVALIERCYKSRQPLTAPWSLLETPAKHETAASAIPPGSQVVITGASGFIGGRLAERLIGECGAKVRCLVRDLGHATRLARLPVEIIKCDLANAADVEKALSGADYVFHCAYDGRSRAQNIDGTRNLIEASIAQNVRRFVYVSTFSVYEPFPDGPLSESTGDGDRGWAYTRNKLDIERMVFDAADRGLSATIVQPTIVYGPYSKPWTNAPAEMLLWGEVILPDEGKGICNAVYIDDLIDGFMLLATNPAAIGQRFVMSGPTPVTWGGFFETFASALGTARPTYWPTEKISASNSGIIRDVKMVLSNPKRIVQIVVRWNPARRALQAGLDGLPKKLRDVVSRYYFGSGERTFGHVFIPDPQTLSLYRSKATIDSDKARRLLGYQPRFEFATGMNLTRRYLDWAYGDVRTKANAQRLTSGRLSPAPKPDLANAE